MRVIFTIIFNGLHHLKHLDYADNLCDMCDHWVIVEGGSLNTGSTSWCNAIPSEYHNNGHSIDGTLEYLERLSATKKNVHIVYRSGFWDSKDHQVNGAIKKIKDLGIQSSWLWEIDCDEQWNLRSLQEAERDLKISKGKTGCFLSDYYVGPDLLARGDWGEGRKLPYKRLWDWNGELFQSHEPPLLEGGNGKEVLLTQRFNHYSYYFEKDVIFKQNFYTGHDNILEKWVLLQKETLFPVHVNRLVSGYWGNTNTDIIKIVG